MNAIPKEYRLFAIVVLGVAVMAVVVTVIVALASRRPTPVARATTDLSATIRRLDLNDLQFPRDFITVWKRQWYPSRPRLKAWTWDQVKQFWIDPRESALRSVSSENDAKMRTLFDQVP